LTRHGRVVPADVKVTGWDNSLQPDSSLPPLTTLSVPYASIGAEMARMLLEQLGGHPGGRTVLAETEIIRRESA
jgi:DNA-binding LacI/PurR family transcriptional regulator